MRLEVLSAALPEFQCDKWLGAPARGGTKSAGLTRAACFLCLPWANLAAGTFVAARLFERFPSHPFCRALSAPRNHDS